MRPNFANFLKESYDLTAGELQSIDRYDVGKKLGLENEQTDELVDQLSDAGMIGKINGTKIILSLETKRFLDSN